jgi:hypothetical protein|tara:strand:+ start:930 stop:1937 length:1008 start_codon:yes stop_codon:yes gene_type:complete
MASLQEIRAKLQAMESKPGSSTQAQGDNAIYPFWNIDEGTSAVMRFLPDSDPNNTFFWVERQMIRLTFPGVVGGDAKPVTVQVPCMEMWKETCPVLTEVRPWFKDPSLEDMGRKYWKKRSYIFQGFVNENPLNETAPENPVRRFVIGPQIFNIIKGALMDPDMENIPTDYVNGTDFRLFKTSKGQYADYSTSKWVRKESALAEDQLAAIDTHGLHNLNDFLPAKPTAEGVQAIAEMFAASVDGELYDPAKWGQFYKPYGLDVGTQTQATVAPAQTAAPVTAPVTAPAEAVVETTAPVVATAPAPVAEPVATAPAEDTGKKSADDILNMIRNRQSS